MHPAQVVPLYIVLPTERQYPHMKLSTSSFLIGRHALCKTCIILMHVPSAFLHAGFLHSLHVGQSKLVHCGERQSTHFGVLPSRLINSEKLCPGRDRKQRLHCIWRLILHLSQYSCSLLAFDGGGMLQPMLLSSSQNSLAHLKV